MGHDSVAPTPPSHTGSDGSEPRAALILSGNALYGTAYSGGSANNGTVFKINTDGTGFTNLHSLNYAIDGANPVAGGVILMVIGGGILFASVVSFYRRG
jgi:uncharacterized repeat protein (TIGR03803 family)